MKKFSLNERLSHRSQINLKTGCVEWTGGINSSGYGHIRYRGKLVLVHRAAWEIASGTIPDGMQVLHKCDNRICRNPDHLFLGTNADNVADRETKGRNITFRGEKHANAKLTEENVKEIREDLRPQIAIARDFGVCQALVSSIKRRVAWSHVA